MLRRAVLAVFPCESRFNSFLDVFFVQLPEENVRKPQSWVGAKENKRLAFLSLCLTDLDSSEDFSVEFSRMFCFALQGSAQMPRPCVGP